MIILKGKQDVNLQSRSEQSMLSLYSNSKMDHIVGLFAIAYASSLTFIKDSHITFQKLKKMKLSRNQEDCIFLLLNAFIFFDHF